MSDVALVAGALLLLVGLVVLILDVAHPGLFLLIPAAVMVAIGIMLMIAPNFFSQDPLVAALLLLAVGCGGAVVAIPVYQRIAPQHPPIASTIGTMTGLDATVTVATQPGTIKGKIRARGEVWSATSERPIPEGSLVRIVGGEGIILKVEQIPKEEEEAKSQ